MQECYEGVNGQPYSAKECYEKGLEYDPEYSGAWFSLGSIDGGLVNGQPYSAKERYEKALEHDPENSNAWIALGSIDGGLVFGARISSIVMLSRVLCGELCVPAMAP